MVEFFKKLWVKIVIEIILVFLMWFLYYVLKNLLPKKYRFKDSSLKEFLQTVGLVLANSPDNEDGIFDLVAKGKVIFEHYQGIEMLLPNSQKV